MYRYMSRKKLHNICIFTKYYVIDQNKMSRKLWAKRVVHVENMGNDCKSLDGKSDKKENTWQDIIKTDLKNRAWPYQFHLAPGRIQWSELVYIATNLHVSNVCFRCYIPEKKIYGTFERHIASRRNS